MTDRFTTPQAASDGNALADDDRGSVREIDDLIDRIRAAHDAGITIEEIHAGLAEIIDATVIPADGNNETRSLRFEIQRDQSRGMLAADLPARSSPPSRKLGSQVWRGPVPTASADPTGAVIDEVRHDPRQSPRGASKTSVGCDNTGSSSIGFPSPPFSCPPMFAGV